MLSCKKDGGSGVGFWTIILSCKKDGGGRSGVGGGGGILLLREDNIGRFNGECPLMKDLMLLASIHIDLMLHIPRDQLLLIFTGMHMGNVFFEVI